MRRFHLNRFLPPTTVLAAVLALGMPLHALADTYELVNIPSGPSDQVDGFTSQGVVLISQIGQGDYVTFNLYTGQEITYAENQAPSLEPLQGVCPAVPPGFPGSQAGSACDNGYILFGSQPNPNGIDFFGIFTGPISDLVNISGGHLSGGGIDAVGDIAWTDGSLDADFAAIDLTSLDQAPEPASLPLVATGLLALAAGIRRVPHHANGA